jgi:diguanylate cyclase (GGDEF)-like protein/PAS domain S-box-containing protein
VGCIQTDITEHRRLEQQLKLDRTIIEQAEEAIVITDFEAIILDVNEAYTLITGYTRTEVIGQNPRITQSGRHDKTFYEEMWRQLITLGSWSGEIWDRRKNGEIFQKWLTINAIRDHNNKTVNYVGIFTDITEKKNIERKIKNLLFYDPLTKLPNRTLFYERLGQAILNSQSHESSLVLFCIDLDRFKDINDSLGHKIGDELLVQVANRIRSGVRKHDIVARLCGDEFTVILSEIKLRESISHLARRMIHLIQQPFYINGEELFIDAGIGISIYPDDGRDPDTLIKNADMALHYAKEKERGSFQYFSSQMNQKLIHRIALEKHLRHALENNEFVLYYQPKYSLENEAIIGMEALIRWQHPEEGLISPAEFIPIAEESSVITALGVWCLKTACRQIKEWEKEGLGLYRVAVNLSSKQFQSRELLNTIKETLQETGLAPHFLELEITESTVMEDPGHTVTLLEDIRQLGVRIAIDDFGTGYSSLAYLKKFPVHILKIDQSFIADLTKDSDDAAIVESIISMARSLNLEVVAEGVETREQVEFLKQIRCQEAQGYYFSKPLPPEQFSEKLRENQKNTSVSS